jgi:hypothetical protein
MYITDLSPSEDELWVSDIGGRNKVRIAAGESTGTGGWAPDSFHLCFVKAGSTYVAGADGSGLRKLTRTQQNCIWSSDQKALFISTEGKVGVTDTWKWNLELPGENETKIADNCGVVSDADPSGRYLLTDGILTAATGRGISEISLSDGKCTALLPDVFTWTTIFARDGKSFLYAVSALDGTIIYRQRWKDGKLVGSPSVEVKVPINLSGFLGDSYSFSSDLSTMIYARPDRRADLYLMSLR